MINKRFKAGILKACAPIGRIKFSLGVLALISACLIIVITSSFVQIKPDFQFENAYISEFLNNEYIPQIPAVMFIAALLGRALGSLTMLIYTVLGLSPVFPVFALGGGADYVFQYSFGYIAGMIFGAYFSAKELMLHRSIFGIFSAVFKGVFIIHIIGILYMTAIAFFKHASLSYIYDLIFYYSLTKILYDLILSLAAVIAAKMFKKLLWIII